MTTHAHTTTAPAAAPAPDRHRFPVAGPAHAHPATLIVDHFPAAGPAAHLVELPDPAGVTPTVPAAVHAHLTHVATARQKQLDALPATSLDTVAAAHRSTVERILGEVRTALGRLEAGLYGTCIDCEREIPQARLELRPWATTCAVCASRTRS